jgi:beta-ureidopropionase
MQEVSRVLYGCNRGEVLKPLPLHNSLSSASVEQDFDVQAFEFTADEEQLRPARKVRVGLIQNAIVLPTTKPFAEQKTAIMERITALISAAAGAGVNIVCLQVSLYHRMPYFSTLVFKDLLMK